MAWARLQKRKANWISFHEILFLGTFLSSGDTMELFVNIPLWFASRAFKEMLERPENKVNL